MGHYAAGSYDRAVAYRHAGADRDVTSQPTVLPDADRLGRFDGLATKSVVNRMLRGVEGAVGAYQGAATDGDVGSIEKHGIVVHEDTFAQMKPIAVVAMERRKDGNRAGYLGYHGFQGFTVVFMVHT